MELISTARELDRYAEGVFVPTMGALHEGHASLVRLARAKAERTKPVIVSIFVNPTQFGPNEDYARYPRTLDSDMETCRAVGADVVFAPAVEEVYPNGGARVPRLLAVATEPGLEDSARPGHFAGVCQVVLRLFELVRPAAAVFGEKDWQQLQVVRAMVREEGLRIEIIPGETVRDRDGMAMSSRNRFLSPADRRRGLALSQGLSACQKGSDPDRAEEILRAVLEEAGVEPDYAVVRDAETLAPRPRGEWDRSRPMRAVAAGRVGPVRLLDNMAWGKEDVAA